jgi:hypothetical protein
MPTSIGMPVSDWNTMPNATSNPAVQPMLEIMSPEAAIVAAALP